MAALSLEGESFKVAGETVAQFGVLQSESDRDRNAIIAYHNETAKQLGISTLGRKSLRMFGILGFTLAETYLTYTYTDLQTALVAGGASAFLIDVASKMGEDWKPVIFGNWVSGRIQKLLREKESK